MERLPPFEYTALKLPYDEYISIADFLLEIRRQTNADKYRPVVNYRVSKEQGKLSGPRVGSGESN